MIDRLIFLIESLFLYHVASKIPEAGFKNPYYQDYNYTGSRVLEHAVPGRFANFTMVWWYQQTTQDLNGDVWAVDRQKHQVVVMRKTSRYVAWPALYDVYAGQGRDGYYDGSVERAQFRSPQGVAAFSRKEFDDEGLVYYVVTVFVADTKNHCIRLLNTTSRRTQTVAGLPSQPGLVDGRGTKAQFHNPTSIGVDANGDIYVLDNHRIIRRIDTQRYVTTLVNGACREQKRYNIWVSVVVREVLCHQDWLMRDTAEHVEIFGSVRECLGHSVTCGPRQHPGILDQKSIFLEFDEAEVVDNGIPIAEDEQAEENIQSVNINVNAQEDAR